MIVHPRAAASDDADLFNMLAKVQPASLGHYLASGSIPSGIRALAPVQRMVGRAMTVKQPLPDGVPVHLALDELREGDILVIDRQSDHQVACVGEMVARAAFHAGAAGIVVDGVVTDIEELAALGLPVYARGTSVITTRSLGVPGAELFGTVSIGGVAVSTGDILFGDMNGILCLGVSHVDLQDLIERALADERREVEWRQRLAAGESLADLNGTRQRAASVCSVAVTP
ncbi:4-hydroxy-4-methyl-2-oxoglutarate aldolase [Paramesorhizobium deserti]|uniref:Putative 4-hydroxy-4-methyl-2-oxoglutarate aldolase n=2 Tax=Paramesorhizobium deserti TaxID=1494590 RepID=A0A135HP73_9HYPH|nr:4-hydroxy-4-methyl-2-oxoglutarate aldolase [Paramesorhizobium deserti]